MTIGISCALDLQPKVCEIHIQIPRFLCLSFPQAGHMLHDYCCVYEVKLDMDNGLICDGGAAHKSSICHSLPTEENSLE